MELRQLNYFIAVAEERHFGRAAKRLHMAQPPLSQQIRQLEEQLGVRLLDRTTRRVDLTAAGQVLLDRGRRILGEIEALEADVHQVGQGTTGVLRVGFCGSATYGTMPALVRRAAQVLPGMSLALHGEMLGPAMEEGLRGRTLDAALLRPPVASPDLEHRVVAREPLVVAAPSGGALDEVGPVAAPRLQDQDFVACPPDSALYRAGADLCRQAGFQPRIARVAGGTSALLSLVAAGVGVAVLPAGARAAQLAGVVYREIEHAPELELAVAWRREDRSALLHRFLDLVADLCSGPVAAP